MELQNGTYIFGEVESIKDLNYIGVVVESYLNNDPEPLKAKYTGAEPYKLDMVSVAKMVYSDEVWKSFLVYDDIECFYQFYIDLSAVVDNMMKEQFENFVFTDKDAKFPDTFGEFLMSDHYYYTYLRPLITEEQHTVLSKLRDLKFWEYDLKYYKKAIDEYSKKQEEEDNDIILFDNKIAIDKYHKCTVGDRVGDPDGITHAITSLLDRFINGGDRASKIKYTGEPTILSLYLNEIVQMWFNQSDYIGKYAAFEFLGDAFTLNNFLCENIDKIKSRMICVDIRIPYYCKKFESISDFLQDDLIYENILEPVLGDKSEETLRELAFADKAFPGIATHLCNLVGYCSDECKTYDETMYLLLDHLCGRISFLSDDRSRITVDNEKILESFYKRFLSEGYINIHATLEFFYYLADALKVVSTTADSIRESFKIYAKEYPDKEELFDIFDERYRIIASRSSKSAVFARVECVIAGALDDLGVYSRFRENIRKIKIDTSLADVVECYLKNHPEKLLEAIKESPYLDSDNLPENINVVISGVEFTVEPKDYLGALK